ncbi:peptidase M15 [Rhodopseudomonas boonkerdii]|uniref:D-alanyl-D-alanine carboxypeptidase n=1 Tax=Rhodopseudomonas boonkerdii TaxID=475937 RepID=UPI001E60D921|nr:D-alanyl-D-alanine carboxypeptidase [Rhodopseudomonas boonkerdii]UGV27140.1 peptidase M15 [Rhodopseudomonas boonkerdii]
MLRTTFASSRTLRVCVLGLVTIGIAVAFTVDTADARRRHKGKAKSHVTRVSSYNPAFASIIVDGNSGAVLQSTNPDALRHPASLTKIMTLYMLFEKLEQGKISLDSQMPVSQHASEQSPTKLGLRPGQTLRVEDAIKGLVTRSANDAAVVIAEAIAGDEDDFAKLMTRKARALGMSRTVYRNASGLPDDAQVTTARDQSVLGRAIQDRFPRYYRYFATASFNFRGRNIRNHNRLIGSVEGVDGIKTGYTRASGFNLVSSMKRGNRHLVGVVLGGRSGGSRDAAMRTLLADNLEKGATRRTVAAITERSPAEAATEVAEVEAKSRPTETKQVNGAIQVATATPPSAEPVATPEPAPRPAAAAAVPSRSFLTAATAAVPPAAAPIPQARRPDTGSLNSGVIQSEPIATIPGSAEPMKPVRVRTVQVKSGQYRVASASTETSAPAATNTVATSNEPPARSPETTNSLYARSEMPRQPAGHGTGNGILGVLPASSVQHGGMAMAYAAPPAAAPAPAPQAVQQAGSIKPATAHSGWIIQVGALSSESEAQTRLDAARDSARGALGKADPFTETVGNGSRKLYRARFAGLDRDQAEAACKTLKRSDIPCITIRN